MHNGRCRCTMGPPTCLVALNPQSHALVSLDLDTNTHSKDNCNNNSNNSNNNNTCNNSLYLHVLFQRESKGLQCRGG